MRRRRSRSHGTRCLMSRRLNEDRGHKISNRLFSFPAQQSFSTSIVHLCHRHASLQAAVMKNMKHIATISFSGLATWGISLAYNIIQHVRLINGRVPKLTASNQVQ